MKTQKYINAFDLVASFIWGFLAVDSTKVVAMREATLKVLALILGRDAWSGDHVYVNTSKTLLEASLNASFLRTDIPVSFTVKDGVLRATMQVKSEDNPVIASILCDVETQHLKITVTNNTRFVYNYSGSVDGLPDADSLYGMQLGFEGEIAAPLYRSLLAVLITGVTQKADALMRKG